MERDDLLAVLDLLGYDDVRIGGDDPGHVNGPCTLLLARRTAREASAAASLSPSGS
jgi:hypothetical protein